MEAGPFVAGELSAAAAAGGVVGSFYLTESNAFWVIGLPRGAVPSREEALPVAIGGELAFCYPTSPVPRTGLKIAQRSVEVTVGKMVGKADLVPGDLGVAADGELAILIRIKDHHGNHFLPISLKTGRLVEYDVFHYLWVRQWRLELVSEDGKRRFTILDRSSQDAQRPSAIGAEVSA